MNDRSPLFDRIRRGKRGAATSYGVRWHIPRRGRIRILLLCIIAATGYKLAAALLGSSGDTVSSKGTVAESADTNPGKKAAAVGIGDTLDSETVAALLAKSPPRLNFDKDTCRIGDDSLLVFFTLDTALQNFVAGIFKRYRPKYGACAVIDSKNGRVLGLVDYRDDSVPPLGANLCLRSFFPAASIYKTVTAAAAIEKAGYTAQTLVPVTGRNHTLYRFQLKKEIAPWNEVLFAEAFSRSINPVFARIGMHIVGKATLEEYSERFGFNTALPFELATDTSRVNVPDDTTYQMAELASGFNRKTTISALHGALIAGAVAENGIMPRPILVDSICRIDGRRLYRSEPRAWRACISEMTACELRVMMNWVVESGTGRKGYRAVRNSAWSARLEYGGKTGSIQLDTIGRIDWFIGFTACHDDPNRDFALGIVTVHGDFWTVHSSFIGAEISRKYFRPPRLRRVAEKTPAPPAAASIAPSGKGER